MISHDFIMSALPNTNMSQAWAVYTVKKVFFLSLSTLNRDCPVKHLNKFAVYTYTHDAFSNTQWNYVSLG